MSIDVVFAEGAKKSAEPGWHKGRLETECQSLSLPAPIGGPKDTIISGQESCISFSNYTGIVKFQNSLLRVLQYLFALVALFFSSPSQVLADAEPFRLNMCQDQTTQGWSFYCRDPEPIEGKEPEPTASEATPQASTPAVAEVGPEAEQFYPATEDMMAYRAHVDELKYRAVLEPTEENVRAYIEEQQAMIDRAGAFTDQWQRVIFSTPELSVLDDYPMASAGISVYQDQMRAAREATFRQVANEAGILFIFNDSSRCGLCRVQGDVLAQMEEHYDVTILAVSKDGGTNEHFPDAVEDDGRLSDLGLQDYPAPTLALVNPDTGEIAVMGSGLITADEILERVFVIVKIPVGERY